MTELDELNATDLAAMFAMMAILSRGGADPVQLARNAYNYAEDLMEEKRRREQEAQ